MSGLFSDLTLLRPLWLLALPLAVLVGAVLARRAGGIGAWRRVVDDRLIATLTALGRIAPPDRTGAWALGGVLVLTVLALSGPAVENRDRPSFRNLDAVVIVMDLSPSVVASGRLDDLRTTARLIAASAGTRQAGLIVFAGEAYVAQPLTTDARALGSVISHLNGDTMPVSGSRPAEALRLTAAMLDGAGIVQADVVVLGDSGGMTDEALAEARALGARGWRVSTVAVTAPDTRLASAGGGVAGTIAAPEPVVQQIASGDAERFAQTDFALFFVEDIGRYLLLLALIPALFLFRRGAAG